MLGIIKSNIHYCIAEFFHIRRKPRIIQLPITSKCNSRCLTCNIWKIRESVDINPDTLKKILGDPFFSEVVAVGINGGEPTLHPNFIEVVKSVLILPKLQTIYLISNCINCDKILLILKDVYSLCKDRGVFLHLQISVDGVEDIHNHIRGIKVSFNRSIQMIKEICNNRYKYVDDFNIGCTISKYNIDYIPQFEDYFSQYNIPIYFHLAVPNKRIHNFDDATFPVMTDKHATQMAKEFFYMKSSKAITKIERIRYFLIYLYLSGHSKKRLFQCSYLYQDITINENLDSYLCATASEKVCNLKEYIPSYKKYNRQAKATKHHCNTCIHYANIPNLYGIYIYYKYKLLLYKWLSKYK